MAMPEKMTTIALLTEICNLRPQARAIRKEAIARHDRIAERLQGMPESGARRIALRDLQKLKEIVQVADEILGNTHDD